MKPKWLLEKDTFEENLEPFMTALTDLGYEYKIIDYYPLVSGAYQKKDNSNCFSELFDKEDCVVAYGSLQLAREVQKNYSWEPGTYADFPRFECSYYYPMLHKFLLNRPYIMLPFGDLINQKDFLFDKLGNNGCLFIRPSSGFKLFTGKVVKKEEFEKDVEFFNFYDVDHNKIVVVAEPKNIQAEWRLVAVNNQIVAASQYIFLKNRLNERGAPDEVIRLGEQITNTWSPDAAWTIDICQLTDGSLHLLEIGSLSCAGLYACDPYAVIKAVSEQALKDWNEFYS